MIFLSNLKVCCQFTGCFLSLFVLIECNLHALVFWIRLCVICMINKNKNQVQVCKVL